MIYIDKNKILTFHKFLDECLKAGIDTSCIESFSADDDCDYEFLRTYNMNSESLAAFSTLSKEFIENINNNYYSSSFDITELYYFLIKNNKEKEQYIKDIENAEEDEDTDNVPVQFFNEDFVYVIDEYNKITDADLEVEMQGILDDENNEYESYLTNDVDYFYDVDRVKIIKGQPKGHYISVGVLWYEDKNIKSFTVNDKTIQAITETAVDGKYVECNYNYNYKNIDLDDIFIEEEYLPKMWYIDIGKAITKRAIYRWDFKDINDFIQFLFDCDVFNTDEIYRGKVKKDTIAYKIAEAVVETEQPLP